MTIDKKKKVTEKEKIIREIIRSLRRCPCDQLVAMYQVIGMSLETSFRLRQMQAEGAQVSVQLKVEEPKNIFGEPQPESHC